ncbi:ZIP Zinc transporter family protein [Cryptosporidium felis]|nr:ZIP Zinc transporter family protein [Cryptosporidium felis]
MDLLEISKILSLIVVILVGGIGVCIPIYIGYLNPTLLQYINVFAGGTLLTLALCHLLPEAEDLVRAHNMTLTFIGVEIPIVAYLTLFGLTVILFFEKALFSQQDVAQFHMHDHSFPHKRDHHHHHHKDPGCVGISSRASAANDMRKRDPSEPAAQKLLPSSMCDANSFNIQLEDPEVNKLGIKTPLISSITSSSSELLPNAQQPHTQSQHAVSSTEAGFGLGSVLEPNSGSSSNVYFLVSALSVHSIFEGMLVGISKSHVSVLTITLIIIAHKWVEGIAVSAGIKKHPEISKRVTNQLLGSFILMSPLGIILGQLFSFINSPIINVVLTCVSAGALLYVALGEMILDEFNCGENRKQKFLLFLFGILLVSIINVVQHKLGGCAMHYSHAHHHHHHHHTSGILSSHSHT